MEASILLGEQIHNASPVDLAVFEDIGWELHISTGIEDDLTIDNGQELISQGGNFAFSSTFSDVPPLGDYIVSADWQIELYHQGGTYIYKSTTTSYSTSWNGTVGFLPIGYTWLRNDNGSVRGKVRVIGTDNDGVDHEDSRMIGIEYPPDAPLITLHPQSGTEVTISYFSPGLSSYKIYYDTNPGIPYSGTGLPQGNSPLSANFEQPIQTFTNLVPGETYYFNVVAENSFGTSDYGGEIEVTIDCSEPTTSFNLINCEKEGLPIILDASAINNDANAGDIFYVGIQKNGFGGTISGYYRYGIIGSFDLLDIEQHMTRYTGPVPSFSQGSYTVSLTYSICGTFYSQQKNINIINPSSECNNGGGGGSARTGLQEGEISLYKIFPNPTTNKVNIRFNDKTDRVEVKILDVTGKLVLTRDIPQPNEIEKINVSNLTPGVYLIQIRSEGGPISSQKLVITR